MFIFSVDRCRNITALLPQARYVRERLGADMRKIVAIAALGFALVISSADSSKALDCPPVCPALKPTPTAPIGAGPWVVGGIGLAALSVIIRAAVVGNRQHRELTSSEAIGAMALPFVWGFLPQEPTRVLLPEPFRVLPQDPFKGIPPDPIRGIPLDPFRV